MAYTDNSDESIACLCAFIATFGENQKKQLKALVENLNALIDVAELAVKIISQLVAVEDQLRLAGLKILEQLLSTAVDTVKKPVAFLFAATKNFADCPPVANVSAVTKTVQDFLFSDVEDLQFQIRLYQEALNKKNYDLALLRQARDILNDLVEAIDSCDLKKIKSNVI
jgi:hypothetical protein